MKQQRALIKISLSVNEFNYLSSSECLNSNLKEKIHTAALKEKNGYILEISDDDADTIRDFCGEQLQKKGFDENYDPTSEGFILESLIDKFFIG